MKHIKYSDYVCADCFYQLPNCTCDCGNFTLIQIDESLQYAIRILNEKGWITSNCCEGHFQENTKRAESYIMFYYKENIPSSCPEHWEQDKQCIRATYKSGSKFSEKRLQQLTEQKEQAIKALNQWVDNLEKWKENF